MCGCELLQVRAGDWGRGGGGRSRECGGGGRKVDVWVCKEH